MDTVRDINRSLCSVFSAVIHSQRCLDLVVPIVQNFIGTFGGGGDRADGGHGSGHDREELQVVVVCCGGPGCGWRGGWGGGGGYG